MSELSGAFSSFADLAGDGFFDTSVATEAAAAVCGSGGGLSITVRY